MPDQRSDAIQVQQQRNGAVHYPTAASILYLPASALVVTTAAAAARCLVLLTADAPVLPALSTIPLFSFKHKVLA
jgi:hypothetical protein